MKSVNVTYRYLWIVLGCCFGKAANVLDAAESFCFRRADVSRFDVYTKWEE